MANDPTPRAPTGSSAERIARLKRKYNAAAIDNGMRLRPDDFLGELEWRDRIDQHYARAWLEFTYGGLFTRTRLDDRTRLLVTVAQFLAMNEMEEFRRQIPAALAAGATPREVLEIVLQSTVYIGYIKAGRGARACIEVLDGLGRLDEITQTQLPLEGRTPQRSLDAERKRWPAPKGSHARGCRPSDCSFENRSGSKSMGLFQKSGWR